MLALATMLHCNSADRRAAFCCSVPSPARQFRRCRRALGLDGICRCLLGVRQRRVFGNSALIAAISVFAVTCGLAQHGLAQKAPAQPAAASAAPSLTVDHDPVRSPDSAGPAAPTGDVHKEAGGYVLHTDVEEVVLNATVLDGNKLVQDLKKEDFTIFEDGVKQTIISFQHTDLPVSIALVIDNSGSMSKKRPAVNKSTLDLIQASNPHDEAFVVNFSDEAFIDQEFTSNVNRSATAWRTSSRGAGLRSTTRLWPLPTNWPLTLIVPSRSSS